MPRDQEAERGLQPGADRPRCRRPPHRDTDLAPGPRRPRHRRAHPTPALPGGNELRQTGDPEEQPRDLCGAFERLRAEDRGRVLNLLGSSSQLVFSTFHDRRLRDGEHSGHTDRAHGTRPAHDRGMVELCAVDERLPPTGYVPLADLERAPASTAEGMRGSLPGDMSRHEEAPWAPLRPTTCAP